MELNDRSLKLEVRVTKNEACSSKVFQSSECEYRTSMLRLRVTGSTDFSSKLRVDVTRHEDSSLTQEERLKQDEDDSSKTRGRGLQLKV